MATVTTLAYDSEGFNPAVYLCEAEHLCGDDLCSSVCLVAARIATHQNSYEIGVSNDYNTLKSCLSDYVSLVSSKQYAQFTPDNSAAPLVNKIASDTKQSVNQVYYTLYELYYCSKNNNQSALNTLQAANTTTIVQVIKQVVNSAANVASALPKALNNLSTLTPYLPYIAVAGVGLYVYSQLPKRSGT